MFDVAGKAVIIVGAATPDNMGQGLARRFSAAGAKVVIAGRKQEPLDRARARNWLVTTACAISKRNPTSTHSWHSRSSVTVVSTLESTAPGGVVEAVRGDDRG